MRRLSDGAVIPHWVSVKSTSGYVQHSGQYNNNSLRIGEVVKVILPKDPNSLSKRVVEYSVVVQERNGSKPSTITHYEHCTVATLFGGKADKFNYTLRPSSNLEAASTGGYTDGSKVLLLCLNGETNNAFIIGAIWDPTQDSPAQGNEDGHNLQFSFNGLDANINKDGELDITFNGANDNAGNTLSSQDSGKTGAKFTMLQDGTVNIDTPANVTIKSTGVQTGDATDKTMLGTSYRNAQSQLHQTMMATLAQMSLTCTIINTMMLAASFIDPALLLPTPVQPFMALGNQMTALSNAIQSFESNANSYLSEKNLSD